MDQPNRQIFIDYQDNPELQAALQGKEVGERCTAEVTFMVKEKNDKGIVGVIEEIAPEGYGDEVEPKNLTPGGAETEAPAAALIVLARKKKKHEGMT